MSADANTVKKILSCRTCSFFRSIDYKKQDKKFSHKKTIFFKGGIKMSLTREEFIRKIKDDVMKDAKISKILPSLTIA